jgi:hypothetical protein
MSYLCPEPDALPGAPLAGLHAGLAGTRAQLVAGLHGGLHAAHLAQEDAELLAEPGAVPPDAGSIFQ